MLRDRPAHLLSAALGAAVLLAGRQAAAYDVQVEAQVIGQGYQLRAADSSIVDRRRLTTYLGLSLWNLGPKDGEGLPAARNQWSVSLLLRFDADLGNYLCNLGRPAFAAPLDCLSTERGGTATSPELSNNRPELLFAYAEGRDLLGLLDLRIGRQLQLELFDVRAFDGVLAEVHTPFYVAAQVWGGLNVTGALPIDSAIYSLDGTDPGSAQAGALQPTVGFALRSYGLRDLQSRLSYRRSFSLAQDLAPAGCPIGVDGQRAACAPGGVGTIEERLAYSLRGRLLDGRLHGWGGARYDFVSGRFDEGNAGARGYLAPAHSLSAEYVYNAPTWDGDSIFNVFATSAYNDLRVSWDGRFASRLGDWRTSARLFGRRFEDEAARRVGPGAESSPFAYGATAGARLDRRAGFLRCDLYYEGGYGGLRTGVDASGRLMLLGDHLGLEGRLTYMYWSEQRREESSVHSFGLQAGVRYALTRGVLLHVLLEDNVNRYFNSQLRLVAMLDLSYYLGNGGAGAPPVGMTAAGMGAFPPAGRMF